MLQLQELCPEIEECKIRKVFLYEKLSQGALSFLGLSRNDETSNSLRTLQFEELTVMRNVLLVIYGGTVSTTFKDDFISFLMLWLLQTRQKRNLSQPPLLIHQPQSERGGGGGDRRTPILLQTSLGKMMKPLAVLK